MASKPIFFSKKPVCKFYRHVGAFLQASELIHIIFAQSELGASISSFHFCEEIMRCSKAMN